MKDWQTAQRQFDALVERDRAEFDRQFGPGASDRAHRYLENNLGGNMAAKLNEDAEYLVKEIKGAINAHDFPDIHAALVAVYTSIIVQVAPTAEAANTIATGIAGDIVAAVKANWKDKAS